MQKEMEEEDVIFDTHAHYDDEAYEEDREDILKLIRQDGVGLVDRKSTRLNSSHSV